MIVRPGQVYRHIRNTSVDGNLRAVNYGLDVEVIGSDNESVRTKGLKSERINTFTIDNFLEFYLLHSLFLDHILLQKHDKYLDKFQIFSVV